MENPVEPEENIPSEPIQPEPEISSEPLPPIKSEPASMYSDLPKPEVESEPELLIKPDPIKLKSSMPEEVKPSSEIVQPGELLNPTTSIPKPLDPIALKKRKKLIIIGSIIGGIILLLIIVIFILASRGSASNTNNPVSAPVTTSTGTTLTGRVFDFTFTKDQSLGTSTDKTTQVNKGTSISCENEIITFQESSVVVGFYYQQTSDSDCFPSSTGDNKITSTISSMDAKSFQLVTATSATEPNNLVTSSYTATVSDGKYEIFIQASGDLSPTQITNFKNEITKIVNSMSFRTGILSNDYDTTTNISVQSGKVFNYSFDYDPNTLGVAVDKTKRTLQIPTPSYPQAYGSDNVICNDEEITFPKSHIQIYIQRGATDGCYTDNGGGDGPVSAETVSTLDGTSVTIDYGASVGTLARFSLTDSDPSIHFGPTTILITGVTSDEPQVAQILKTFTITSGLVSTNFDTTVSY